MHNPWFLAIASVIVVSLISLVGAFVFLVREKRLQDILFFMVALAVGALFGDAMIHLLPEIFTHSADPVSSSLFVLAGVIIFFILEKFLHWKHQHHVEDDHVNEEHKESIKPVGYLSLIADGLHNFLDGLVIGVSYLAGPQIGFATTLAVILHELPQEIGDMGLLLHSGFTKTRALVLNFVSALVAILGTVISLSAGSSAAGFTSVVLPIAAGGFLYIAGSDLVPELHKVTDPKRSAVQLLAIAAGIGLMLLLLLLD